MSGSPTAPAQQASPWLSEQPGVRTCTPWLPALMTPFALPAQIPSMQAQAWLGPQIWAQTVAAGAAADSLLVRAPRLLLAELGACVQAVPTVLRGTFQSSGQNCAGVERVLVHQDVHDQVLHQVLQVGCWLLLVPAALLPAAERLVQSCKLCMLCSCLCWRLAWVSGLPGSLPLHVVQDLGRWQSFAQTGLGHFHFCRLVKLKSGHGCPAGSGICSRSCPCMMLAHGACCEPAAPGSCLPFWVSQLQKMQGGACQPHTGLGAWLP